MLVYVYKHFSSICINSHIKGQLFFCFTNFVHFSHWIEHNSQEYSFQKPKFIQISPNKPEMERWRCKWWPFYETCLRLICQYVAKSMSSEKKTHSFCHTRNSSIEIEVLKFRGSEKKFFLSKWIGLWLLDLFSALWFNETVSDQMDMIKIWLNNL